MPMTPKDKLDIILALRETAKGIEQSVGPGLALQLMQALGTELLVLALKSGPLLDEIEGGDAPEEARAAREAALEDMIRIEIAAIANTVASVHEHRMRECDVIHARLTRMFDPAPAFNEAMNRAIEAKKAKLETVVAMTPAQKFSFDQFQVPSLMNALLNAGHADPVPMVHRVNNDVVSKMGEALGKRS